MASLVETAQGSQAYPAGDSAEESLIHDDARDARQPEGLIALDRRVAALCRERGPLRAVLARLAAHLIALRAWERIGYARLSDYAVERLGLSARWVQSLAEVGVAFWLSPGLEEALVSGTLGWTKVRLLASLPRGEDQASWIELARRLTAEQLSKKVRAVDRGSLDSYSEQIDERAARSRLFEVRCSPDVRWKWHAATAAARRVSGRVLHVSDAAELIAAEVLSALPADEEADPDGCDEASASWSGQGDEAEEAAAADAAPARAGWARRSPCPGYGVLESFLAGLGQADAFELDDRFRRALSLEQRLDARVGPLLALVWDRWVHRALGYRTREAYARERLGMDPTRARTLVRLERAAAVSEPFAHAYRTGALSWVKAGILVPLVSCDPLGLFMKDWVAWAERVTVRRLRDDVEWALALEDTDRAAFQRTGGLPPEARGEGTQEIRTPERSPENNTLPREDTGIDAPEKGIGAQETEIGAPERGPAGETCSVRFIGPAEVVQLLRMVLCTVRRRMESDLGRLPTAGEALEAMLDHALLSWGALNGRVAVRHRVFDRDGWRCTVPGCTSMQNLHDHHIQFRSAGGSNDEGNRTALCAFHHLRGVHAERVRCAGQAPDGLTWQMGIRPGAAPLVAYRSGDVQIQPRSGVMRNEKRPSV
jgi:hypothetical protein